MSLKIDNDGTITMYQGDTGEVVINGLDSDKNYQVFFSVRDKNNNIVGEELRVTSNGRESVSFFLPASLTNQFVVPRGSASETYYYGVKLCELSDKLLEDTLFIADKTYGEKNLLIVFPKIVEGPVNE
jgi:hypothetical protein